MYSGYIIYLLITYILNLINGAKLEYRIQNGFPAEEGEFPMVVLLIGKTHRCTGTIIAANKILTAGHCACGDPTTKAFANTTQLQDRFSRSVQLRQITKFAYPVSYNTSCNALFSGSFKSQERLGGASDIAILTTDKPFDLFSNAVEIAKLSTTQFIPSPEKMEDVIVLGYGKDSSSETTGQLLFGFLKLSICPSDITINTVDALCANTNMNYQTPDIGDSGGPILDHSGKVLGVTSISGSGWIVFSSVYTHYKFIQTQLTN